MLKDVVSKLDYSVFDQIALVIFSVCFIAIVWGVMRLSNSATERFGAIPLTDQVVDPRVDQHILKENHTNQV